MLKWATTHYNIPALGCATRAVSILGQFPVCALYHATKRKIVRYLLHHYFRLLLLFITITLTICHVVLILGGIEREREREKIK